MVTPTKILLTGFEPFGQLKENPSQIVAEALGDKEWDNAKSHYLILPVEFMAAKKKIADFYQKNGVPDIILHFGVAKSRNTLTLERFAVNMMDTENGDNIGYFPDEFPVITNAPLAYRTTIPCKRIMQHLRCNGYEAKLSNSAGTYVCNTVLFTSLHFLSNNRTGIPHRSTDNVQCGFIHLPLFETVDKNLQLTIVQTIIQWLVKNHQQAFQDYPFPGNAQSE